MSNWLTSMGWTRVAESGAVTSGPALLGGIVIRCAAADVGPTLYAADSEQESERISQFVAPDDGSYPFIFPIPLEMPRGIYIKMATNVSEVLVLWKPAFA